MLAQQDLACEIIAIADADLLQQRASALGLNLTFKTADLDQPAQPHQPGTLQLVPVELAKPAQAGQLDTQNARYVINTLELACKLCLDGLCDALTTGPVQKSIINDAGIPFSGHTELLARYCGGYPVMMLATEQMRVALATTHLPLSLISQTIDHDLLIKVIRILDHDLRHRFALNPPRIAVCGLNPHAGEGGHLGREEIDIIEPALQQLREEGIELTGPIPADTAFNPPILERHDVILAMYHDQGLPTLKYSGFGDAVNITLGLPIIRTSVDHGTALELAGTGQAKPDSLQAAVEMARKMVLGQRKTN